MVSMKIGEGNVSVITKPLKLVNLQQTHHIKIYIYLDGLYKLVY